MQMFLCRSHQMYYMFGFLFLVFIILVITCSEATVLLCYFHLCAEVRFNKTSFNVTFDIFCVCWFLCSKTTNMTIYWHLVEWSSRLFFSRPLIWMSLYFIRVYIILNICQKCYYYLLCYDLKPSHLCLTGLSLVVAIISDQWFHVSVSVCLRSSLLLL